jgi:hypothetical protein
VTKFEALIPLLAAFTATIRPRRVAQAELKAAWDLVQATPAPNDAGPRAELGRVAAKVADLRKPYDEAREALEAALLAVDFDGPSNVIDFPSEIVRQDKDLKRLALELGDATADLDKARRLAITLAQEVGWPDNDVPDWAPELEEEMAMEAGEDDDSGQVTIGRVVSPDGVHGTMDPLDAFAGSHTFTPDGYVRSPILVPGRPDGRQRLSPEVAATYMPEKGDVPDEVDPLQPSDSAEAELADEDDNGGDQECEACGEVGGHHAAECPLADEVDDE